MSGRCLLAIPPRLDCGARSHALRGRPRLDPHPAASDGADDLLRAEPGVPGRAAVAGGHDVRLATPASADVSFTVPVLLLVLLGNELKSF